VQPQADGVDDPGLRADRGRVHAHRIPADCYGGAGRPSRRPARGGPYRGKRGARA
jgi:hypothetical protein